MIATELERQLRPPQLPLAAYPPKSILLANGEELVVREARLEEAPLLLETVYPLIGVSKDFYDIVAARLYAELLGWIRHRTANEFVLVGAVDGEIVGMVNSRLSSRSVGMSLHTITIRRGLRIGAQLFAAKMEHHIEILGQDEVWIVAESPIGFRRWMIEYGLEDRTHLYPEVQHELGGVPTYVLTRERYFEVKDEKVVGTRPVEEELLRRSETLRVPTNYPQIRGYTRTEE